METITGWRLWLATLLYNWACRLAGTTLNKPWNPDAPEAFARLQAERMERAARMWKQRHDDLRRKHIAIRQTQRVDF